MSSLSCGCEFYDCYTLYKHFPEPMDKGPYSMLELGTYLTGIWHGAPRSADLTSALPSWLCVDIDAAFPHRSLFSFLMVVLLLFCYMPLSLIDKGSTSQEETDGRS